MTRARASAYREVMSETPNPMSQSDDSISSDTVRESPRQFRRSYDGKVIAGVARGLANRFDIDANIFRVLFVLLALFWGLGVALYLALWVFVPRAEEEGVVARTRPPASRSRRLAVVLMFGAVVAIAALVAAFARGGLAAHGGPSLALFWLVFLVALAIVALRTPALRITLGRVVAVAFLAALSVLIVFIGAVMGFVASTGVPLSGGNGAHSWRPTSLSDVQHQYTTEFGTTTVDLQSVRFPSKGYTIDVSAAIGSVWIDVPANAVVSITTHVGLGPVELLGSPDGSAFSALPVVRPASLSRAPHLVIDARVGIGRIVIVRAT